MKATEILEKIERVTQRISDDLKIDGPTRFYNCDCGSRIMHSNGGNYHQTIEFRYSNGVLEWQHDNTCELLPAKNDWKPVKNLPKLIRDNLEKF